MRAIVRPLSEPVDEEVESIATSPAYVGGSTSPPTRILLLHVPDCPNLGELRRRVQIAVAQLGVNAAIEEVVGPYPSPTLLVNGDDVTGRPLGSEPSCRLDTPTNEQIMAAITRVARIAETGQGTATAPSPLRGKERNL